MKTSLKHNQVTFTIPGTVSSLLFERKYVPEQMITLAANVFRSMLLSSARMKGKELQPGIMATLHKSGNGLNYNPHVHLVGTMDIYSFIARMLYFLPDKHRKMIRYYGLYAHGIEEKLRSIDIKTWAKGIEHSFQVNPEVCPDCFYG